MSAFLCNDRHISYLVAYASRPQYNRPAYYRWEHEAYYIEDEQALGQKLIDENYRSLAARYNHKDTPHKFQFSRPFMFEPDPVQVIKACDCYHYQACETGDAYYQSEAHAIVEYIRERAINELPGYDAAQWEVTFL